MSTENSTNSPSEKKAKSLKSNFIKKKIEPAFIMMDKKGRVAISKSVQKSVNFKPSDKFIICTTKDSIIIRKEKKEEIIKDSDKIFHDEF